MAMRPGIRLMAVLGRSRGRLSRLPLAGGWTDHRDLPAPEGASFQDLWRRQGEDDA